MLSYFLHGFHWKKMVTFPVPRPCLPWPRLAPSEKIQVFLSSLEKSPREQLFHLSSQPCFASSYHEIAVCSWNSYAFICCEIKFQCFSGFLAFTSVLINNFRHLEISCFDLTVKKSERWKNLIINKPSQYSLSKQM